MNSQEFVTKLNTIHQREYENTASFDQEKLNGLLDNVQETFYKENQSAFQTVDISKMSSLSQLDLLCNQTGCIEGTIVDAFEPKMIVSRHRSGAGFKYTLYQDLTLSHQGIEEENSHGFEQDQLNYTDIAFAEVSTFVLLVKCDSKQLISEFWDGLSNGKKIRNFANGIPILIRTILPRENFNLGTKLKVAGLFHKEDISVNHIQEFDQELEGAEGFYNAKNLLTLTVVHTEKYRPEESQPFASINSEIYSLAQAYLSHFNSILKDDLASKLLLAALLTYQANGTIDNLNYINLNIYGMTAEIANQIIALFDALKISTQIVSITKETLAKSMIAQKNHDYDILLFNQLYPGMNEAVVTKEFDLSATQLSETETLNVMRLAKVVDCQTLMIQFYEKNFVNFSFENPFISFSETRSIFRSKYKLCLRSSQSSIEEELPLISSLSNASNPFEFLKALVQQYLRNCTFVGDSMKEIEQDFVAIRQLNSEFSQEDFGSIIVLAKYLACFNGSEGITYADYQAAKSIFFEIEERTKNYLSHNNNKS